MSEPQPNLTSAKYKFDVSGKSLTLDFPHAFALGDMLLQAGQLEAARSVFEALSAVNDRGPRARIMLARCQAGLSNFTGCSATLQAAFEGEKEPIAENLHSAFVFIALGLRDDAIQGLGTLAMRFENYPTICLLLGDLFAKQGDRKKARDCWNLAIRRDQLRGGVALSASRRLKASDKGAGD